MPTWDPALDTGILEIDEQHRALFARATRLVEAIEGKRAADEVAEAIRFLIGYVREHFGAEEALMRQHGYPELEAHAAIHRRIVHRLDELVAAYRTHGGSEGLVGDLEAMMRGWVSLHIGEKDRAFVEFLHRTGTA
jgi:hemerythrin